MIASRIPGHEPDNDDMVVEDAFDYAPPADPAADLRGNEASDLGDLA